MGKLVVVEGSDFSGKETQAGLLFANLKRAGLRVARSEFPRYDTPTGKIVGGPLLGKEYICHGFFPEGGGNVPAKVAAMYFAADRIYNRGFVIQEIVENDIFILDRWVGSNMAHQAGKLSSPQERDEMFAWLASLEYGLCALPPPDIGIILHVPYEIIEQLRAGRAEKPDEVERDESYLRGSISAYLEMAQKFPGIYHVIECAGPNGLRTPEDIGSEIFDIVYKEIQRSA